GTRMATTDIEASELTKWDPGLTERVMGIMRPFLKRYFRSEVRGLENLPPGGALLVSNHSGGMLPMDVPILSADFYQKHGYNRPMLSENKIDFGGRTGYVKAALNAGVPIVPTVGIGGQETQIFLTRGTWLAKRLGPIARLARAKIVPISFGFPFGLSLVVPPNIPLPAKITMQV